MIEEATEEERAIEEGELAVGVTHGEQVVEAGDCGNLYVFVFEVDVAQNLLGFEIEDDDCLIDSGVNDLSVLDEALVAA